MYDLKQPYFQLNNGWARAGNLLSDDTLDHDLY